MYEYIDPKTNKKWRKVLFERETFPDNFTPDECFLAAIKRNQNLHEYTFWQCFHGASQVTLQLCVVFFFALAYMAIDMDERCRDVVLALSAFFSILGYGLMRASDHGSGSSYAKDLQHVSIFLIFSFSFSPVLYKLTDTISTDTIYTTAGVMLFVHLMFHNYGLERAPVVSSALSLNAALFASVCLASRLASSYDAFVLLTSSVVAFVLFPIFRQKLCGPKLLLVTLGALAGCAALLTPSIIICVMAALSVVLVLGVAPCLFVRWQSFKHTIHGPWDEAVPNNFRVK